MTKTPALLLAAVAAVAGLAASADAQTFTQTNRVFLTDLFNGNSALGSNVSGVGFSGTTAYVGGFNNTGAAGTVGVGAVTDLFGTFGSSTNTSLAGTVVAADSGRGLESVAYDAGTNSILTALSTGGATGDVSRYTTAGVNVFTAVNPNGRRPFAVGSDPMTNNGDPSYAAFLSQGSGRRLALDIDDGSVIYSSGAPSPGGAIIFDGTLGSAFRGMDFRANGDLVYATANGFGVFTRTSDNTFSAANIISSVGANNIGRDVAFLEGAGAGGTDLLAIVARDSTTLAGAAISDTNVYITDLSGNILQTITGDESGLAAAFANDTKAVDYALAPDGSPTLVITDFVSNRLDVYQIAVPEPTSLGLLGLGGLTLLRRRR